jgi:hypothetical protein
VVSEKRCRIALEAFHGCNAAKRRIKRQDRVDPVENWGWRPDFSLHGECFDQLRRS